MSRDKGQHGFMKPREEQREKLNMVYSTYRKEGILYLSCSGRTIKITTDVLNVVEHQMHSDDETTAVQLQKIL
uniref:Uncharacterized protein n=1 Tax=Amphimedon queenslandica TaxID=400682 RepID=A0A1X7VWY8_AMPQE